MERPAISSRDVLRPISCIFVLIRYQSGIEVLRSDIERALDELISNEEGMRFQGLAVVLAKQKWPDLIACERKWDRGLDAYARASLASGGNGIGLACSLTATLDKIEADAKKIKENFGDVKVLIFATPQKITNHTASTWADSVREKFGYELIVISREDIITSLMVPSNGPICRAQLGIPVAFEEEVAQSLQKAQDANSEETAGWFAHPRLAGKPLVSLQAVKLNEEGKETRELFDLASIEGSLMEGRRIVLEAPAGRGKTTTLVQLAQRLGKSARLAFLVDLPSWVRSRQNILEFIAHTPPFRSRSIDGGNLASLYRTEHFSFLLNGWNEISETYSEEAARALAQLERSFPAAGIIVATRTHHISPPLPGSFRAKLLLLNRAQRTEYLKLLLPDQAEALGSLLDANHVLDD